MRGVTYHRLIKVTNLHFDTSIGIRQRAKVSHMAVATDPNCRAMRQGVAMLAVQPFVILRCIPPHVGMG